MGAKLDPQKSPKPPKGAIITKEDIGLWGGEYEERYRI
jgi:hypothetical protein